MEDLSETHHGSVTQKQKEKHYLENDASETGKRSEEESQFPVGNPEEETGSSVFQAGV